MSGKKGAGAGVISQLEPESGLQNTCKNHTHSCILSTGVGWSDSLSPWCVLEQKETPAQKQSKTKQHNGVTILPFLNFREKWRVAHEHSAT